MSQTYEDMMIDRRAAARGQGEILEGMYRGDAEDWTSMVECERLIAEQGVAA